MKKTNKKASVQQDEKKQLTPVEATQKFLKENGYVVYVSVNHKQHWRCVVIAKIAKLLGVEISPAVQSISTLQKVASLKKPGLNK